VETRGSSPGGGLGGGRTWPPVVSAAAAFAHFRRQAKGRPQVAHTFVGRSDFLVCFAIRALGRDARGSRPRHLRWDLPLVLQRPQQRRGQDAPGRSLHRCVRPGPPAPGSPPPGACAVRHPSPASISRARNRAWNCSKAVRDAAIPSRTMLRIVEFGTPLHGRQRGNAPPLVIARSTCPFTSRRRRTDPDGPTPGSAPPASPAPSSGHDAGGHVLAQLLVDLIDRPGDSPTAPHPAP
jgi:hypothetical protein